MVDALGVLEGHVRHELCEGLEGLGQGQVVLGAEGLDFRARHDRDGRAEVVPDPFVRGDVPGLGHSHDLRLKMRGFQVKCFRDSVRVPFHKVFADIFESFHVRYLALLFERG